MVETDIWKTYAELSKIFGKTQQTIRRWVKDSDGMVETRKDDAYATATVYINMNQLSAYKGMKQAENRQITQKDTSNTNDELVTLLKDQAKDLQEQRDRLQRELDDQRKENFAVKRRLDDQIQKSHALEREIIKLSDSVVNVRALLPRRIRKMLD